MQETGGHETTHFSLFRIQVITGELRLPAHLELVSVSPERPEADRMAEGTAEAPGVIAGDPYVVN